MITCQKGGKNAQNIGQISKDKVAEFDPTSTCTDAFLFDGASNDQNLEKFSVQYIQELFVSMVVSMFCLYFEVILLISDQSK